MVWDKTTRALHWIVAAAVVLNLFVLEEGEDAHRWLGYAAVGAVALRGIWGFAGGEHSRFRSFPLGVASWRRFFSGIFFWRKEDFPGHNPLASVVYLLIWACIISLGITGWMMGLDAYWGEEWLEEIHANISTAVQVLVGLHLAGILLDSVKFRRHTWLGMITGKK